MKKVIFFSLSIILHMSSFCLAQPIFEENFDYPAGKLTEVSSYWIEMPVANNDVYVIEGSLSYPGYASSNTGNMIFLDGGLNRSGVTRNFNSITGNGKNVYVSFLMNVFDTTDLYIGDIFKLRASVGPKLYFYIKHNEGTEQYKIGFWQNSSLTIYLDESFYIDTTYLIVLSYQFRVLNDSIKLWINPDLSGNIPPPDLCVDPVYSDASNIESINFVPGALSGDIYIDGIRLDTTWAQAPLPVELSSFTAAVHEDRVTLDWRTETEVDNYGFEVEKRKEGSLWEKIAFINGHGSCNTPKEYSFSDKDIFNVSEMSYRLKQIDNDGAYSFSKEIKVTPFLPGEILLLQNYPNPFNPVTRIRYKIPQNPNSEDAFVTLKIFNVLGKEIATPVKGINKPGTYEIEFNAEDLSAGVYFYRLGVIYKDMKEFISGVKKFIVLK